MDDEALLKEIQNLTQQAYEVGVRNQTPANVQLINQRIMQLIKQDREIEFNRGWNGGYNHGRAEFIKAFEKAGGKAGSDPESDTVQFAIPREAFVQLTTNSETDHGYINTDKKGH